MSPRALVLHVGLPKTATTFFQHQIFPKLRDYRVVYAKLEGEDRALAESLVALAHVSPLRAWRLRPTTAALIRRHAAEAEGRNLLISNENISMMSRSFYQDMAFYPARIADRLARLARDLRDDFPVVRVMIGIRRQEQWLPSHYSESGKRYTQFGQEDFEARVARLCAGPLRGVQRWLDYAHVEEVFVDRFGADNLMLVPLERLGSDTERLFAELGGFLGQPDLLEIYRTALAAGEVDNKLSVRPNTWRMKGPGERRLELREETARTIGERFHASNARAYGAS